MGKLIQGDIWWVDLPGTKNRQPVIIVQCNAFSNSALQTVVCILLTPQWTLAAAPGNTIITPADSGLPKTAVANAAQLVTLNHSQFSEYVGAIPSIILETILDGVQLMLGR